VSAAAGAGEAAAEGQSAVPVVTIDGPGGSGKGTLALQLAKHLGWHFLDSGSLYRLTALAVTKKRVAADDEAAVGRIAAALDIRFEVGASEVRAILEGEDVSRELRLENIGVLASRVAALPAVRAALVVRQRQFRRPPGLVADGRDMGTVIFPDARLKVYLTASAEVRAQRRYKQLKEKGENVNLSRLFKEIKARDERDQTRAIAPLKPADDAVIIDSTDMNIDEVFGKVCRLL